MKLPGLVAKHTVKGNAKRIWKDAATIILTSPHQQPSHSKFCDYDVLMLKRSSKSAFFPNNYVFPGGKIDATDCSAKWYDVYSTLDTRFIDAFDRLKVKQTDGNRSPLLSLDSSQSRGNLSNEVAFRICAIRETFEESGILLSCQEINEGFTQSGNKPFTFSSKSDVEFWRTKVHNDAAAFLDMCHSLGCVPDVWSLHEWSNWLTPTLAIVPATKRYDTIFYKAFIQQLPGYAQHDNNETMKMIWKTPLEVLNSHGANEVEIGHPQVYELRRCLNFKKYADLHRFTVERELKGMERWMPIIVKTSDDIMLILYPGDRFYPQEYTIEGVNDLLYLPYTYGDILQMQPPKLNHGLWTSPNVVVSNYTPRYGHVSAISSVSE